MTWSYDQSSGELRHNGSFEGTGYSGTGIGRNSPDAQAIHNTGPIPQGRYHIDPKYDHPHLGPCVMNLEPLAGTITFGRSLFRIHGDNARHDASEGCIILGPLLRAAIANSGDHDLEVLP